MSSYDAIARLYDPWSRSVTEDVSFYVEEAERVAPGPIVELAVGTGRIAVPIAAAGVSVEGRALAARVGVHTGTVVVSALGDGASAETLALGQVPNVAARVQSVAKPGSVLMTAATQRLVAGLFVTEEHGAQQLQGLSEPLTLYRAVQASGVRGRAELLFQLLHEPGLADPGLAGDQHDLTLAFLRELPAVAQ